MFDRLKKAVEKVFKNDFSSLTKWKKAIKRAEKYALENELDRWGLPKYWRICVDWTTGGTYGAQATAFVNGVKGARTSGWGYDKLSTAIANALNKSDNFKCLLFDKVNKLSIKKICDLLNKNNGRDFDNRLYCLYFRFCGVVDGGCGVESIVDLFDWLGFKKDYHADGKLYDELFFTKRGARK